MTRCGRTKTNLRALEGAINLKLAISWGVRLAVSWLGSGDVVVSPCHRVVSLYNKLYHPLSTQVYKWYRRHTGVIPSHPGAGGELTLSVTETGISSGRVGESTLVSAGHVAPKIWVLTRMCYRGGVAECKIVTSVRMVESTGGDVSFFRNICGDKNSFYRQVFLHYIRTFDIEAVHVILNFKTLSLTIAIVNGSRHESQHSKFTTRQGEPSALCFTELEMKWSVKD